MIGHQSPASILRQVFQAGDFNAVDALEQKDPDQSHRFAG